MLLFLAINSKYIHTNIAVRYFYHLCKELYPCEFLEFNINQGIEDVLFEVVKRKPRYVAISTYIWNVQFVRMLTEGIKKLLKDTV
ncbi:MAG TPA: B12-binding domain-containing radical SAM protein, partial [bacterium]|nr:B12-binding domain-containing radical SAM protein [bacterium]